MTNVSPLKQAYYTYLGRLFWFTYHTQQRPFLGFLLSSWLKFLALVLFLAAFGGNWGLPLWAATFLLLAWIWLSYWRAGKAGYMRFNPDMTTVAAADNVPELAAGKHVDLYASGLFAVMDREERVLLRPSEYWRAASGEHGVMVQQPNKKFLYQFFRAETLEALQPGWLIFGKEPLRTVAVSFWQTWGPDYDESDSPYVVGEAKVHNDKRQARTIYFTFTDTAVENQVVQKLLEDIATTASWVQRT